MPRIGDCHPIVALRCGDRDISSWTGTVQKQAAVVRRPASHHLRHSWFSSERPKRRRRKVAMGKKIQCIGRYVMDGVTLGKGNFAHVELATHGTTQVKVRSSRLITWVALLFPYTYTYVYLHVRGTWAGLRRGKCQPTRNTGLLSIVYFNAIKIKLSFF